MSAPDKIYLNYPKGEMDSDIATWDTKTFDDCENICYIRKDYLLEWAKEMYEAYRKRYEQRNALYYRERMAAFLRIIDKLNEI